VTKKVAFLNYAIGELDLNHRVTTINDDVKNIKSKQFDIITSRAYTDCVNFLMSTKIISKKDSSWMIMTTLSRSSKLTADMLKKLKLNINKITPVTVNNRKTNKQIIWLQYK